MKRIIYLPFDHLHRNFGALKQADPKVDVIAMVESAAVALPRNDIATQVSLSKSRRITRGSFG